MDDHLGKPIRVEELDALLQRWASRPERRAAPSAVATGPHDEAIDVEGLLDRVEGDLGFVRELTCSLRDDCPRWLADLRAAFRTGDRGLLEQTAHAIRGSAANLGGRTAATLAARLESRAHAAVLGDGAVACAEIEAALDALLDALAALGDDQLAAS
jgi:HPt (histidine-containing phosphotransfer) domain-containing protein